MSGWLFQPFTLSFPLKMPVFVLLSVTPWVNLSIPKTPVKHSALNHHAHASSAQLSQHTMCTMRLACLTARQISNQLRYNQNCIQGPRLGVYQCVPCRDERCVSKPACDWSIVMYRSILLVVTMLMSCTSQHLS